MNDESVPRLDTFEFLAAILLGLGAILTAVASFEANLWGGIQAEAYSKANTLATAAASENSKAIVEMARDAQVDITAYQLGQTAKNMVKRDPEAALNAFQVVSYLYRRQLSDAAYKALELPTEARTAVAANEEEEDRQMNEILAKTTRKDLSEVEGYRVEMLAKAVELQTQSEATFKEGQVANTTGDKFNLSTVVFAVGMFFFGIALVFKTSLKWWMLTAGAVLLVIGTIYLLTLPWTF